jgi:hypothetical protein
MIRFFNWFRRGSLERGLERELQYHFDRRVADLIAAGIPDIEARRASPSSSASPRSARKSETSGSRAGSAISSTISASPPDRSSAALASPRRRCSRWPSASALPPPSTRWSTR